MRKVSNEIRDSSYVNWTFHPIIVAKRKEAVISGKPIQIRNREECYDISSKQISLRF